MVTIKNFQLSLLSKSQVMLTWENEGESSSAELIIERSDAPDSEYVEVGRVADTIELFVDEDPLTFRKYIPHYYRVKHPDLTYSNVVNSPMVPDRYVLNQNRLIDRYLKRDVGILSYYFRKKSYGIRCECWNDQLKKSVVNDCVLCAGTGFQIGYADPYEIYIGYPPEGPNKVEIEQVTFSVMMPNAWTTNYPPIFPGDVIIRPIDMEVFIVGDKVNLTGRRLYPSRQMFPLRGVEHGSVEYDLIERIPS